MRRTLVAVHAMELPQTRPNHTGDMAVPEWVQLLPLGRFEGRDGRGPYTLRDQAHAQAVIAETARFFGSAEVPGDYDHQLLYTSSNGQQAPASGWIKELQARADGLWGRVVWTAAASARIAAREYRYVSPVFNHKADGAVTRLRAFALTNTPNLDLTALASSAFTAHDDDEELPMTEEQLKALRAALGLKADATVEQITAHATGLVAKVKAAETSRLAIAKVLGADEKATDEQLAVAATSLAQKAKGATTDPDPAQFVPMKAFKELQDQVAAMSTTMTGDKATAAIADAKADGKLSPAMEDWAKNYAAKDLDGFIAWCSAAPVIVTPSRGRSTTGALPPAKTSADGLSEDETAVCAALGIKPEDFKKTRAAERTAA